MVFGSPVDLGPWSLAHRAVQGRLLANRLLQKRPSDRVVARQWHDRRKRRAMRAEQKQKAAVQHIYNTAYHGTVHTAPVNNGIINAGEVSGSQTVHSGEPNPAAGAGVPRESSPTPTPEGVSCRSSTNSESNSSHTSLQTDGQATDSVASHTPKVSEEGEDDVKDVDGDGDDQAEDCRLDDVKTYLSQVHRAMVDKLAVQPNGFLEDRLCAYALTLNELSPAHFCVLEKSLLSTITDGQESAVLENVQRLPAFPGVLENSLSRYNNVGILRLARATY